MIVEVFLRAFLLLSLSGVGWFLGKKLSLSSKDISALLVYVIAPLVIFYAIVQSPADWTFLKYSLAAFSLATLMALVGMLFAKLFFRDSRVNLFGFAAGTGNTGYFALPLVLAIFDQQQIAIAIFIIIGVTLYEFTVGYFITANGALSYKESLLKVVKMPIIYAAALGMLCKYLGIQFGDILLSFLTNFKGAYSVLGMMTIGITISQFAKLDMDWLFSCLAIAWKHFIYPVVALTLFIFIIPVDQKTLQVIALMAATPMAGNVVIIANNLGLHPEKAATSVMLSTVFAIITVPISLYFVLNYI
nr:AEC family transporter [Acinetobacter sp. Marseille-Q1620]